MIIFIIIINQKLLNLIFFEENIFDYYFNIIT
jgi:hypothetical protein